MVRACAANHLKTKTKKLKIKQKCENTKQQEKYKETDKIKKNFDLNIKILKTNYIEFAYYY